MANTTKKRKQPSKWQQDVQNQAGVEWGVGRLSLAQRKEQGRRNEDGAAGGWGGGWKEGEGGGRRGKEVVSS